MVAYTRDKALTNYLSGFITPSRLKTFAKVLDNRTRFLTVVLEDLYQPHNASAVLRSCDCFGIQDVHIIENRNSYTINPDVALGSSKWLNLVKYNQEEDNTLTAYEKLRNKGYRIVATTTHKKEIPLEQFDLTKGKAAIVFGTELDGLSNPAIQNADEYLQIPMFGFTESFNISVAAAIILYHLVNKLRKSELKWHLSNKEKLEIKLTWLKNSIRKSEFLTRDFLENNE